jgi:aspartate/methionine/tyrosine aminotransferase
VTGSPQPLDKLALPLANRVAGLPDAQEIGGNVPPLSEGVIEAAFDAMKRGETHYTDRPGILPLRQAAADRIKKQSSVEISPKDITITCDATEARFIAIKILAERDSVVFVPGDWTPVMGAVVLADSTIVAEVSVPDAVSVAYVTPDDDETILRDVLPTLPKAWIVWDVSSAKNQTSFHPAQIVPASRVVTIDGLASELPGWRIGWMAGSEVAERLRSLKQNMTICATSVAQWAAVELLNEMHKESR